MHGTTKGLFFNGLLHLIDEKGRPGLKEKISRKLGKSLKYISFKDYPIQEYVIIKEEIIKEFYPDKTHEEGVYELGKVAFDSFSKSLLGKTVIPYIKKDPRGMLKLIPTAYKRVDKFGTITTEEISRKKVKIKFRKYKTYPQHQQGLLQEGMDTQGLKGKVTLDIKRLEDRGKGDILADFDCIIEWE